MQPNSSYRVFYYTCEVQYDRIVTLASDGDPVAVLRGPNSPLSEEAAWDILHDPPEELSFCKALQVIQRNSAFSEELIERMFVVKDLRNRAAHGELPLLDTWEPPLDAEGLQRVLKQEDTDLPEAYRFIARKGSGKWHVFRLQDHQCGSFRALTTDDRFAAIQYLMVLDIIRQINESQAGDYDLPNY